MLRYPVGDIAAWVDYDSGTFTLHGRSAVGVKISSTHLPLSYLKAVVPSVLSEAGVPHMSGFQTVVRRVGHVLQSVTYRIAAPKPGHAQEVTELMERRIAEESPSWTKNRSLGNIAPLQIEWVGSDELIFNPGTGKLRDIIEERF